MQTTFYKYHGTGNDFIMIDNRENSFPKNDTKLVARLCDRRFGIGADGLILLENESSADFRMVYYNSDGNTSSMCGNGGRCIVAFARQLGIVDGDARFIAADGPHNATLNEDEDTISLHMKDVNAISLYDDYVFLDTGSPHHVEMVEGLKSFNVKDVGHRIRYSGMYGDKGTNVNFVEQLETDIFSVRTYERGVEDETFSCGTGVTAVAIAMHATGKTASQSVELQTPGGKLQVSFSNTGRQYSEIYLTGPAAFVFEGYVQW